MTTFRFTEARKPGVRQFVICHCQMVHSERYRSWSREAFCRSPQRVVPDVELGGRFVDDFHFVKGERMPGQWPFVSDVGAHSVPLGGSG
jgi:hypothetical protein